MGDTAIKNNLIELKNIDSLKTLAIGNYYVDGDGIVYWIDDMSEIDRFPSMLKNTPRALARGRVFDKSKLAIAKVNFIDGVHKNRHIYIDKEGRIGYVLNQNFATS